MVRCECRVVGLLSFRVRLAVQCRCIPNIAGTYHPIVTISGDLWGLYLSDNRKS